jgi:hypothetical protein
MWIVMQFRAMAHGNTWDSTTLFTCKNGIEMGNAIIAWKNENEGRSLDDDTVYDEGGVLEYDSGEAIMVWKKEA